MPRRKDFVAVLVAGSAIAAGLALPSPTHAQDTDATPLGFYAGGGASYSNVSVERPGSCYGDCYSWWGEYPTYDEGDGDYAFVAHVGYRVGRCFAVEAGYVDAGTIGWDKDYVWMPDLGGYYRNTRSTSKPRHLNSRWSASCRSCSAGRLTVDWAPASGAATPSRR